MVYILQSILLLDSHLNKKLLFLKHTFSEHKDYIMKQMTKNLVTI